MKKILAVAVMLCAGKSYAADVPQIDWNKDPVAQSQAYLQEARNEDAAISAAAARSAAAEQTEQGPIGIEGVALTSAILSFNDSRDVTRSAELTLNNGKDRVGAEVGVCDPVGSGDMGDACDYVRFLFPQLSVSGDRILLGEQTVATIRHSFLGGSFIKMEEGFKLSLKRETISVDTGFDRVKKDKYSVSLEQVSK